MPKSEEKPKSFWTTTPGILTGLAAVITALLTSTPAIINALHTAGIIGNTPKESSNPVSPDIEHREAPGTNDVFYTDRGQDDFSLPEPVERVKARFFCQTNNGIPATVAETSQGNVQVINWTRYVSSEWTPEERCLVVSERFQKYSNEGNLDYITTGRMNRQNVICVAQPKGNDCARQLSEQGLLFTITNEKSPDAVLLNLMGIARFENLPPINESDGDRVYVDMNKFLRQTTSQNKNSVESVEKTPQNDQATEVPCFFGCGN